jgi:hypothetical protein
VFLGSRHGRKGSTARETEGGAFRGGARDAPESQLLSPEHGGRPGLSGVAARVVATARPQVGDEPAKTGPRVSDRRSALVRGTQADGWAWYVSVRVESAGRVGLGGQRVREASGRARDFVCGPSGMRKVPWARNEAVDPFRLGLFYSFLFLLIFFLIFCFSYS